MKLSYLLKECVPPWERVVLPETKPSDDPEITSVHARAQQVKPGGLFIAVKGSQFDGHDFIDQAFENGAVAAVVQQPAPSGYRQIPVKNTRKAMASIAALFYGKPSERLTLIGITGTNGKTTTAWLLESILTAAGLAPGVIGTVNVRYMGKVYDTPVTTPESIELQRILYEMAGAGVTHVIMEVSSHGVDLNRVDACDFDIGIFTNLTQDHLDYHKTMTAYWKCKKAFFTKILPGRSNRKGRAVLNINSEKGTALARTLKIETLTVGTTRDADIYCTDIRDDINGLSARLWMNTEGIRFQSPLAGGFNLENILCAAGAARFLEIDPVRVRKGIERLKNIPGRLERVGIDSGRFVFVDYAHTPDALESILATLKNRAPARLITVFGCGGDRDITKRDKMGAIASSHSDLVIITSDNPRTENPDKIIRDILKGVPPETPADNLIVEPDRKKALERAVTVSQKQDTIVAAGKGHETYQIIRTGKIDFDDRDILRKALDEHNPGKEAV